MNTQITSSPAPSPLWIERTPYWLTAEGVQQIERMKNAIFMGHWCTKRPSGGWNESPVDVFYVPNPDTSRGHTHYFGMFFRDRRLYICEASTAFSEPISGILAPGGEVLVSRFRHDYQARKGVMVDGGRDYLRSTGGPLVAVRVHGPEFILEPQTAPKG